MFPKRFHDPRTGFELLSSMNAKKYLKKMGMEREDYFFFKQVGKALLFTYTIMGAIWLFNGGPPMAWSKPKPRLKEEQEQAHNQSQKFPYLGNLEAVKELISKRGMNGTSTFPKGVAENCCKEKQNHQEFEQEAQKIWLRMRNEVVAELKEKGFDVK